MANLDLTHMSPSPGAPEGIRSILPGLPQPLALLLKDYLEEADPYKKLIDETEEEWTNDEPPAPEQRRYTPEEFAQIGEEVKALRQFQSLARSIIKNSTRVWQHKPMESATSSRPRAGGPFPCAEHDVAADASDHPVQRQRRFHESCSGH